MTATFDHAVIGFDEPLGEGNLGMSASVADRVDIVADPNYRDLVIADGYLAGGARLDVGEGEQHVSGHQAAASRRASFAVTPERILCPAAATGIDSMTSAKNPATMRRSASLVGTPRLSR